MTDLRGLVGKKGLSDDDIAAGILVAGLAVAAWLVAFVLFTIIGTLFFLLAWNLGVVGLAGAVGLAVSTVSLTTAFGAVFLLRIVRRVLGSIGKMNFNAPTSK